jgi:Flp pilus assembly pilin Flp
MALNRILDASMRVVARTRDEEEGQALVEYSLLILLLAVAAIAAVRTFGLGVSTLYQSIINVYP